MAGYFLIVWDFINYTKNQDIPVGPGRGSGATQTGRSGRDRRRAQRGRADVVQDRATGG